MITRRRWTPNDDVLLESMAKSKTPNHLAADLLRRTQIAIYTRRRVLGYYGDGYGPNDYKPTPDQDLASETQPGEIPGYWSTVWSRSFLWGLITITKQRRTP
jgi:hypothetical protein